MATPNRAATCTLTETGPLAAPYNQNLDRNCIGEAATRGTATELLLLVALRTSERTSCYLIALPDVFSDVEVLAIDVKGSDFFSAILQ